MYVWSGTGVCRIDDADAVCVCVCCVYRIDETDAFCWVYDESRHYFEPFGLASEVGLL
jgi:hypothetical protein